MSGIPTGTKTDKCAKCRHATLLLWGKALRDDTKNGYVVDYYASGYPHWCDIIFNQSAYSIFARCQALVVFRRLVFTEFSRVKVEF